MTDDRERDRQRDANQGEGNREAAREYNEATRDFVESGRVEEAARDAANASEEERERLRRAEEAGKAHAQEEDPNVARDYQKPDEPHTRSD